MDEAVTETVARFGRIDSCFANAGVGPHPTAIDTMSTEEWRRVMAVNLDGVFYTVRAVAAAMKAQRSGGSIVFTSSVSISDGMAFSTHYAAAKSALVAMARALAVELARDDIRVNALVPGWTMAAMTDGISPAVALALMVIAGAAVYLAGVQVLGGTDLRELKAMVSRNRKS